MKGIIRGAQPKARPTDVGQHLDCALAPQVRVSRGYTAHIPRTSHLRGDFIRPEACAGRKGHLVMADYGREGSLQACANLCE